MFFLRRKTQPIKHRSPYLVIATLVCILRIKLASFLSGISISLIFFLDFTTNNVWKTMSCRFYSLVANVLHFTLILPYIFRSNRLVTVFNLNYVNINNLKNKLSEQYYLKVY